MTSYAEEIEDILDSFQYEECEICGQDIDMHAIAPDFLGHAHVYCLVGQDAARIYPEGNNR